MRSIGPKGENGINMVVVVAIIVLLPLLLLLLWSDRAPFGELEDLLVPTLTTDGVGIHTIDSVQAPDLDVWIEGAHCDKVPASICLDTVIANGEVLSLDAEGDDGEHDIVMDRDFRLRPRRREPQDRLSLLRPRPDYLLRESGGLLRLRLRFHSIKRQSWLIGVIEINNCEPPST